jgi:hypothetical protein
MFSVFFGYALKCKEQEMEGLYMVLLKGCFGKGYQIRLINTHKT